VVRFEMREKGDRHLLPVGPEGASHKRCLSPFSRTVYLKRARASHLKDALKDLLRLRRVRTRARHEFDMLVRFRRAGISVPDALAAGERHILGRDVGSFVLVAAVGEGRPLDAALAECESPGVRLDILRSLARSVRAMHDAGLTHGELFARHVFAAERSGGAWTFSFIDLQQAKAEPKASRRRRARDLAALLVSLPPDETTMRERLAFLREYLGHPLLRCDDLAFARETVLAAARRFARRDGCKSWRAVLAKDVP
jgi:tRNA A-37 threonylcarbamoyl transferase component Bud32